MRTRIEKKNQPEKLVEINVIIINNAHNHLTEIHFLNFHLTRNVSFSPYFKMLITSNKNDCMCGFSFTTCLNYCYGERVISIFPF